MHIEPMVTTSAIENATGFWHMHIVSRQDWAHMFHAGQPERWDIDVGSDCSTESLQVVLDTCVELDGGPMLKSGQQ